MNSSETLYGKILSKEGIVGLIAFMLVSFLMWVVYTGQQEHKTLLIDIKAEEKKQTEKMEYGNEVLEDIRYSLRQEGGLVFRNKAE